MKILGQSMAKATVDKFEDKGFYGVRSEPHFAAISARLGKIYAAWSENCDMESVVRQSTLAVKVLAGSLLV